MVAKSTSLPLWNLWTYLIDSNASIRLDKLIELFLAMFNFCQTAEIFQFIWLFMLSYSWHVGDTDDIIYKSVVSLVTQ